MSSFLDRIYRIDRIGTVFGGSGVFEFAGAILVLVLVLTAG